MGRPIILTVFLLFHLVVNGQDSKKANLIDPKGTYKTHFHNPNGSILPQGVIKIKMLNKDKIVISLIMQSGKPLLRSGKLMDTLRYHNNYGEFKNAEIDSTCKITFHFTSKGITVKQFSKFQNRECDFADGVSADGFYKKESSKVPSFNHSL